MCFSVRPPLHPPVSLSLSLSTPHQFSLARSRLFIFLILVPFESLGTALYSLSVSLQWLTLFPSNSLSARLMLYLCVCVCVCAPVLAGVIKAPTKRDIKKATLSKLQAQTHHFYFPTRLCFTSRFHHLHHLHMISIHFSSCLLAFVTPRLTRAPCCCVFALSVSPSVSLSMCFLSRCLSPSSPSLHCLSPHRPSDLRERWNSANYPFTGCSTLWCVKNKTKKHLMNIRRYKWLRNHHQSHLSLPE